MFISTRSGMLQEISAPWRLTTMVSPSQVRGSVRDWAVITTFRGTRVLLLNLPATRVWDIRHACLRNHSSSGGRTPVSNYERLATDAPIVLDALFLVHEPPRWASRNDWASPHRGRWDSRIERPVSTRGPKWTIRSNRSRSKAGTAISDSIGTRWPWGRVLSIEQRREKHRSRLHLTKEVSQLFAWPQNLKTLSQSPRWRKASSNSAI